MVEITGDFDESIKQIQAMTDELKESNDRAEAKERARNSIMTREEEILEAMAEVPTDKIIDAMLDSNELTDLLTAIAKGLNTPTFINLRRLENYAIDFQYDEAEKIVDHRHSGENIAVPFDAMRKTGHRETDF